MSHLTQAKFLVVVAMLSVDWLNPVKFVCRTTGLNPILVSLVAVAGFGALLASNIEEVVHAGAMVFFRSILSIFFSSVEVIGLDNVPLNGPVIYTGNHMNQFVDGIVMISACKHKVGFLIAEKSYKAPVIGHLARWVGSLPVARPQDSARKGVGKIVPHGKIIRGVGGTTNFTVTVGPKDKIRLPDSSVWMVVKVLSDSELEVSDEIPVEATQEAEKVGGVNFDLLKYINQAAVYETVTKALSQGNCIGIFPEGGSHDRTQLLPLKAGVAIIAYAALENHNVSVPIVPVGLNYFRGHRFRGRVVVEFGAPIRISEKHTEMFHHDKKAAYQTLLTEVEEGMRSVIVTAPNYEALQLIYMARRLYQKTESKLSAKERQDGNRRFAEGYKLLMAKYDGKEPPEFEALRQKLENYTDILRTWGLRDYQVPALQISSYSKLVVTFLHMLAVFSLCSLPTLILNLPVGVIAKFLAERERKTALKASVVKVHARDVMMSKKIVISLVLVPTLWVFYAVMLLCFSPLPRDMVLLLFLSMPILAYLGVISAESGMTDLKDLRPAFLRLLPQFRQQAIELPKLRADLQKEVRNLVHKYGPELGSVYFDQSIRWDQLNRNSSMENITSYMARQAAEPLNAGDGSTISAPFSPSPKEADAEGRPEPFPQSSSSSSSTSSTPAAPSSPSRMMAAASPLVARNRGAAARGVYESGSNSNDDNDGNDADNDAPSMDADESDKAHSS